ALTGPIGSAEPRAGGGARGVRLVNCRSIRKGYIARTGIDIDSARKHTLEKVGLSCIGRTRVTRRGGQGEVLRSRPAVSHGDSRCRSRTIAGEAGSEDWVGSGGNAREGINTAPVC